MDVHESLVRLLRGVRSIRSRSDRIWANVESQIEQIITESKTMPLQYPTSPTIVSGGSKNIDKDFSYVPIRLSALTANLSLYLPPSQRPGVPIVIEDVSDAGATVSYAATIYPSGSDLIDGFGWVRINQPGQRVTLWPDGNYGYRILSGMPSPYSYGRVSGVDFGAITFSAAATTKEQIPLTLDNDRVNSDIIKADGSNEMFVVIEPGDYWFQVTAIATNANAADRFISFSLGDTGSDAVRLPGIYVPGSSTRIVTTQGIYRKVGRQSVNLKLYASVPLNPTDMSLGALSNLVYGTKLN